MKKRTKERDYAQRNERKKIYSCVCVRMCISLCKLEIEVGEGERMCVSVCGSECECVYIDR